MNVLTAAAMESYSRSYPEIIKLHILQEIDQGYQMIASCLSIVNPSHSVTSSVSDINKISISPELKQMGKEMVARWNWGNRLEMMSPLSKHRAAVLSIRRAIFESCRLHEDVAENWLSISKSMMHANNLDSAWTALRNAERYGISVDNALLQV